MKTLYFFLSIAVFFVFHPCKAQLSMGGLPITYSSKHKNLAKGITNKHSLKNIDNKKEKENAEKITSECITCEKNFYGTIIEVDIDIKKDGKKIKIDDGNLWLYKIESVSAYGLQLYFDRYNVPSQASLFIYNEDGTMVLGAFTQANNNKSGMFATQIIKGNSITIEYFEPDNPEYEPELHINKVVHDFMDFYGQLLSGFYSDPGGSESCEKNIKCSEGNGWENESSSVVMSLYEDSPNHLMRICSGSLINTSLQDGKPYYLNAGHCFFDQNSPVGPLSNIVFLFNYEALSCNSDGSDAIVTHSLVGCELKVNGFGTGAGSVDFTLVELFNAPPLSWNICYSGWDINSSPINPLAGIHHPRGDVKKISLVNNSSVQLDGNQWKTFFDIGSMEPGSSGSPLFNNSHRIIGVLSSGCPSSTCCLSAPNGPFYYEAFNSILNFSGVKQYLDPNNTGVTFVNTYCPTPANADFYSSSVTVPAGNSINFFNISSGSPVSFLWSFPGGVPSSSSAQNPTVTYNTPGNYDVILQVTYSNGYDIETKAGYITVNSAMGSTPIPDFTGSPVSGTPPLTVTFTDQSSANPIAWAWDVNNDGITDYTIQNPTHTYNSSGTYSVRLIVTNQYGSTEGIKINYIAVSSSNPLSGVDFTWTPSIVAPSVTVLFESLYSGGGTNLIYDWDFGDGSNHGFLQNESHSYFSVGSYNVQLCITDVNNSFTSCTTKTLTVTSPNVTALFAVDDDKVEVGQLVKFYEQSYPHDEILYWKWEWEGPATWYTEFDESNYQQEVNHIYFSEGPKFVRLSVTPKNAQNTIKQHLKVIYVYDCQKVRNLCSPLPYYFIDFYPSGFTSTEIAKIITAGGTCSLTVMPNATVNYEAFEEINLKPGFTALSGSNFTASVKPCPANRKAQNTYDNNAIQTVSASYNANYEKIFPESNNIEQDHFFEPISKISLYPNPADENLKINILLAKRKNIKLTISDIFGREVYKISEEIDVKEYNINLTQFASGLYYVRIVDGENVLAFEKIIVANH